MTLVQSILTNFNAYLLLSRFNTALTIMITSIKKEKERKIQDQINFSFNFKSGFIKVIFPCTLQDHQQKKITIERHHQQQCDN